MTFYGKKAVVALVMLFLAAISSSQVSASNTPWIGIYMQDVDSDLADAFNLAVSKGVLINDIADKSPAEKAGLKQQDVILEWNGQEVKNSESLSELVSASKVGDNIKLTVNRGGKQMEIAVQIGERSEPRVYGQGKTPRMPQSFQFFNDFKSTGIGVSLQALSGQLGDYFGVSDGNGALITEVMKDTPAEKAGLKVGDVIVKVDGEKVESPNDVSSTIGDKKKGEKVDLVVIRDKAEKSFAMEVDEINSFGSIDMSNMPTPRFHTGENALPQIFQNDNRDYGNLKRQMEQLQDKLTEMQRKLESLENKVK